MVPPPGLEWTLAFASQPGHALLDAEQAQPFHLPDIKALPVVLNDQHQALRLLFHADADSGRVGMTPQWWSASAPSAPP